MENFSVVAQAKQVLRQKVIFKLKTQKEEERNKKNREIEKKLFTLSVFKEAKIIMFYISCGFEVDTLNMIKEAIRLDKKVAVPVLNDNNRKMNISLISGIDSELETGPYGIKQPRARYASPISADQLDLIIVPAIAFDSGGQRLGRGKGYYDIFLAAKSERTRTVGLAFQCQIVENLPQSPHDIPVEQVISA